MEVQKRKTAVFSVKLHFTWRKSAIKFPCLNTVSDRVVRHLLHHFQLPLKSPASELSLTASWPSISMSHPWFDAASIMRQIRAVRKSLTTESVKTLVHALIASILDYCNSVFYQLSAANLQALQSVLNAGACLIMWKRKYDHITSTLRDDLHWLPIRQRIMYKLSTIIYKCTHGAAPPYLMCSCRY